MNLDWLSLVLAGGGLLTYLRLRRPVWVAPILCGLAGGALVAVILLTFTAWRALPAYKPLPITPENVEEHVREWADTFRLGSKKLPLPNTHFGFEIILSNGVPIAVVRQKGSTDKYLFIIGRLDLAPPHKALMEKLPENERERIAREVFYELAKIKIGFIGDLPNSVSVLSRLPITESLTEANFVKTIDEVESGITVANATIEKALAQAGDNASAKQPSPLHKASQQDWQHPTQTSSQQGLPSTQLHKPR